jgi:hypothetical protein
MSSMRSLRCVVAAGLAVSLLSAFPTLLTAQTNVPVVGRWDLTVQGAERPLPSWVEVTPSGHATLVGRFVGDNGSARPIARVTYTDGVMRFAIPPQWQTEPNDMQFEARYADDRLTGTLVMPDGERRPFTGVRAPLLRRTAPPVWDTEVVLFDGRAMDAWTPLPGGESKWRVVNGILTNTASGANLATKQTFTDFKLHLEFRYPRGGNSGVYLRGRHEVQIEDNGNAEPTPVHLGGVYGFLTANENVSKGPGEWQTYDITLIGRRVTVVLNGKTIIADQTIPGITGGALDANEGDPGPIYLQGDHTAVEFRNIRITPAKQP